jgi:hypothetical protein
MARFMGIFILVWIFSVVFFYAGLILWFFILPAWLHLTIKEVEFLASMFFIVLTITVSIWLFTKEK